MGFDLIKEDISVVKSDIVIFITGWSYKQQFQRVFDSPGYDTMNRIIYIVVYTTLCSAIII